MSKEDLTCKVSSVYKHKERKPKKPHYIPRPWGKPYNYKCFQCPFTCMEKSHLYNHMKYSLCKNSLSLLIESEWPYKKGNLLHPELRPLQPGARLRGSGREEVESAPAPVDQSKAAQSEVPSGGEEPEEGEDPIDRERGQGEGLKETLPTKEARDQTDNGPRNTTKRPKQTEADFVITDVFSLEDQLLNARAVEVEAKLKHYKLSKTCLTGPSLLSEQWRLLATSHRKANAEGSLADGGSMSCYPPVQPFAECQEPPALNLSVLGVSYPLSPGLFSYINPPVPGATPAHAQLAQLPFLASAAQLMHPPSGSVPPAERSVLSPRFYYPLLCEHAFAATQDSGKGVKPGRQSPAGLEPKVQASYAPKVGLWKVPALRPSANGAPPALWATHQQVAGSAEPGYGAAEEKSHLTAGKDNKMGFWSHKDVPSLREQNAKRTGVPPENQEGPQEKKPFLGSTRDLLKNTHGAPSLAAGTEKLLFHGSTFRTSLLQTRPAGEWLSDSRKCPSEGQKSRGLLLEPSSPLKPGKVKDRYSGRQEESDAAAGLLGDLSKALQEYQEADRKISHLAKEDSPGQRYLRDHLCKIRSELSHIHQALEKTTRQHEGPLDLSVKKALDCKVVGSGGEGQCSEGKGSVLGETEEEGEEEEEEEGVTLGRKLLSQESCCQAEDVMIKISHSELGDTHPGAVVKTEVVSPSGLGIRPSPVEALWPSRTTKCEADSSVLLCPDGRSAPLVFTDFTSSAKTLKRPSSKDHPGEMLPPPSPLTPSDP
ncbi:PRR35 protein, partial [Atractosteus spatula]|nr:PRR35 protein [Atractosteus spatula]